MISHVSYTQMFFEWKNNGVSLQDKLYETVLRPPTLTKVFIIFWRVSVLMCLFTYFLHKIQCSLDIMRGRAVTSMVVHELLNYSIRQKLHKSHDTDEFYMCTRTTTRKLKQLLCSQKVEVTNVICDNENMNHLFIWAWNGSEAESEKKLFSSWFDVYWSCSLSVKIWDLVVILS